MNPLIVAILCVTLLLLVLWGVALFHPPTRAFVVAHFIGIATVLGSMAMVADAKLQSTVHFGPREIAETLVEVFAVGCTTVAAYKSIPGRGNLAALKRGAELPTPSASAPDPAA